MSSTESGDGDGGQLRNGRTSSSGMALTIGKERVNKIHLKEVKHSMNNLDLGDKARKRRVRRRCKSSGNATGTIQVAVREEDQMNLTLATGAAGAEFACQTDARIGMMTLDQLRTYALQLTYQYNGLKNRYDREKDRECKLLGIINSLAKRGHKHPYVQRIGGPGGDPASQDVGAVAECGSAEKHDKATNIPENPPAKDTLRVADMSSIQEPVSSGQSQSYASPLYTAVRNRISESEEDSKDSTSAPANIMVKVEGDSEPRQNWMPTKIYGQYQYRFEVIIPSPGNLFVPKRSVILYFASAPTIGAGLCIIGAQKGVPSRYFTFRQNHAALRGPIGIWPPISQAEVEIQTCFSGVDYFRNWLRVGDDIQICTDSAALHWDNFPPFAALKTHLVTTQSVMGCRIRLFHDVAVQNVYLKVAHMLTTYNYYPHQESPYILLQTLGIIPGGAHSVLAPL